MIIICGGNTSWPGQPGTSPAAPRVPKSPEPSATTRSRRRASTARGFGSSGPGRTSRSNAGTALQDPGAARRHARPVLRGDAVAGVVLDADQRLEDLRDQHVLALGWLAVGRGPVERVHHVPDRRRALVRRVARGQPAHHLRVGGAAAGARAVREAGGAVGQRAAVAVRGPVDEGQRGDRMVHRVPGDRRAPVDQPTRCGLVDAQRPDQRERVVGPVGQAPGGVQRRGSLSPNPRMSGAMTRTCRRARGAGARRSGGGEVAVDHDHGRRPRLQVVHPDRSVSTVASCTPGR